MTSIFSMLIVCVFIYSLIYLPVCLPVCLPGIKDGDINTARACYDRALDATPPQQSLPVLMEYARMETSRSFGGGPVQAKKLFELAVKRFPGEERYVCQYVRCSYVHLYANANIYLT